MPVAPETPPRLWRETAAVGLGSLALSLAVLRVRPDWTRGVIGGQDAWQNLWNLRHVDRALREGLPLLRTDLLWAPEGASLRAHTLSLTNTLPGALLGRVAGFFAAYNALVVLSFVLCAVALYRLARRLGARPAAAALGAAVFAFCPPRIARALGHLNLLGIGWVALALEGLWLAAARRGARRLPGVALAAAALVALAYTDWYLALLGALAAVSVSIALLAARPARAGAAAALGLAAALALVSTLPSALALRREIAEEPVEGHESRWCSAACTSLVIPSRLQVVSALTKGLTERNHQNAAEGPAYLGLAPLLLTGLALRRGPRPALFIGACVAGAVALVLALGPQPRIFDRLLEVRLPYAWLEAAFPALKLGGCVNRFLLLAFLPLALGTALAGERLLAAGRRGAFVAAGLVLAIEYAPRDPGVSVWPFTPPDAAMVAIAESGLPGNVLDLDPGAAALIRQMRHARPQTLGYLSRTPPRSHRLRLADPVLGPLLDGREAAPMPTAAAAALLRHRWGITFVVTPDADPFRVRAASLGFPRFAQSPGLSIAYRVPEDPMPLVDRVDLGAPAALAWDFLPPEEVGADGRTFRGRWTSADGGTFLAPVATGSYRLVVTLPRPGPVRIRVAWAGRAEEREISATTAIPIAVRPTDTGRDGLLRLTVDAWPKVDGRFGVFVVALERE